jgi:hypothetical protein
MKTTILSLSALLVALFADNANMFAQKKEKDKILANKVYAIELTETGGKKAGKPQADEISFKGDKLSSKFMTQEYKFPPSPYTVSVDSSSSPHTITFQSESKSSDEVLKWDGTITGDAIEGTAVISKKEKTKKEYSFSGNLKAKGGKK